MITFRRCTVVFAVGTCVFVLMQILTGTPCFDCGARVGFPFAYRQEGRYGTVGHTLWLGFWGDWIVSTAVGTLLVWSWRTVKSSRIK